MKNAELSRRVILDVLHRNKDLLKSYGVKQIGLFGSFVRDEGKEDSDVDFLVDFEKEKKTLSNLVNLGEFLEDLFEKKVDIITPQGLSPFIGPHILKEVQYASFQS